MEQVQDVAIAIREEDQRVAVFRVRRGQEVDAGGHQPALHGFEIGDSDGQVAQSRIAQRGSGRGR